MAAQANGAGHALEKLNHLALSRAHCKVDGRVGWIRVRRGVLVGTFADQQPYLAQRAHLARMHQRRLTAAIRCCLVYAPPLRIQQLDAPTQVVVLFAGPRNQLGRISGRGRRGFVLLLLCYSLRENGDTVLVTFGLCAFHGRLFVFCFLTGVGSNFK